MIVFEYLTSPIGTVHLAYQIRPGFDDRTLCGADTTRGDWLLGDETVSGLAATCRNCIRLMEAPR